MQFRTTTKELGAALRQLGPIAKRNGSSLPILRNVRVRATGADVRLEATDLESRALIALPAKVESEGEACMDPRQLAALVRQLPKGELCWALEGEAVRLEAGETIVKIPTRADPSDWPELPDSAIWEVADSLELEGEAVARALDAVLYASSSDFTRYALCTVYLEPKASRVVTTDGHRLACTVLVGLERLEGGPVLLPNCAGYDLRRLLGKRPPTVVRLERSGGFARWIAPEWTLYARLVDGEFPDYRMVIPKGNQARARFDRAALAAALKASLAGAEKGARVVRLSWDGTRAGLEYLAGGPAGAATFECDLAAPGSIAVDARYMLEAVEAIDSDSVTVRAPTGKHAEVSPIVFQGRAPYPFGVLMPVRV